jgi:hypothetical protein
MGRPARRHSCGKALRPGDTPRGGMHYATDVIGDTRPTGSLVGTRMACAPSRRIAPNLTSYSSPFNTMLSVSRVAPMYAASDTSVGEPVEITSTGSSRSVSVTAT